MMTIFGTLFLLAAIAAIILMIAGGIELALKEKDDERVEALADARFHEMCETAEIRVVQKLIIIDEMRR